MSTEQILRDKIEDVLRTVHDPEIPVNVFDLGLIYKINILENNDVHIYMTLTAPACPVAGEILMEVEKKVKAIAEIGNVEVRLTFEPPWNKDMMNDEARLELGWL